MVATSVQQSVHAGEETRAAAKKAVEVGKTNLETIRQVGTEDTTTECASSAETSVNQLYRAFKQRTHAIATAKRKRANRHTLFVWSQQRFFILLHTV